MAEALGLTGTPGIIVMSVNGATPETITVFPEAVTAEKLQAAIRKAKRFAVLSTAGVHNFPDNL